MYISASGLVVKSNIAIVGPRVWFYHIAMFYAFADMEPTCHKSRHLGVSCRYPRRHVFAPCRRHVGRHVADMLAPTFHVWRFGPLADMPTSNISQLSGLLHHQAGPSSIRDVYYHLPLGKVLLSETAHGHWKFGQYISSLDDGPDGIPRICASKYWSLINHN